MGREVENLIRENTELLETKNALNIVKNDLIARVDQLSSEREVFREEVRSLELVKLKLNDRIRDLESELKEMREKNIQDESTEEDMAQRKRFTRVEMARVLMERNQYKEKLFELQEAVKFTELQRARKSTMTTQNKSIIWSFFSNLLGDSTSPASSVRHLPHSVKKPPSGLRKNIPSSPMTQRKKRNYIIEGEVDEKRMAERRQHYNAVRQHMKQEDYPHAYGWSMPPTKTAQNMSIPVPVNCRPLLENLASLKISCAASCSLYGGISNGEYIYGDPILGCDPYVLFQNILQRANISENPSENKTIGDLKRWNGSQFSLFESSSLIWICCTNEQQRPYIIILDVNNPSHILETFTIDILSEHLCIASIPGVHETDIRITAEGLSKDSELCTQGGYLDKFKIEFEIPNFEMFGAVDFIKLQKSQEADEITYISDGDQQNTSPNKRRRSINELRSDENEQSGRLSNNGTQGQKAALHRTAAVPIQDENEARKNETKIEIKNEEKPENPQHEQDKKPSPLDTLPLHIRNTLKRYENVVDDDILTLSTMWIGTENECVYIYSAVKEWRKCLRRIFLPDAVLSILHSNGRVFIALANGSIAIFHRDMSGQWSAEGYHLMTLGTSDASICHLCEVNGKIWAACKNSIIVFDPVTLRIDHTFIAHPRKDSKIRQLVAFGIGVWISIRLDTTIRLFHSKTHEHLQDIDVESFITKMLGPNKLDMVLLRITSMSIMNKRIWIGTGSGIIVSIPLSESNSVNATKNVDNERVKGPGQVVRVMSKGTDDDKSSIIPFCEISQAQLSFHSFKDPVRFLIPLFADGFSDLTPNTESLKLYMVSGGDGYIDFRLGDDQGVAAAENSNKDDSLRVRDLSHLLIWESESSMNFMRKTAKE